MKYSMEYVLSHRTGGQSGNSEGVLRNKYIILNYIGKRISPYPTYLCLNLGIGPDTVTFISFFAIILGSISLILGNALSGAVAFLFFFIMDSVDGDLARCTRISSYGIILDSFGADLFYACAPASVGYFLYSENIIVGKIMPNYILLVGAFASITFLLCRIVIAKLTLFRRQLKSQSCDNEHKDDINQKIKKNFIIKIIKLSRHYLFRGNFFAEPGMILWFFVFISFKSYKVLSAYLITILIYNISYLIINFINTYSYFKKSDKKILYERNNQG
ncbi:MAG: CDP-alcohol phosphatidyltransferase family protein [Candidatus Falkowbacteria bacterium]